MSESALTALKSALSAHGLIAPGALSARDAEGLESENPAAQVMLIGNAGPAMWRAFDAACAADAALAADPDPMDAWTRRVVTAAVSAFAPKGAAAVFPFEGPPHYPFQRWAVRAGVFHTSPIGPLVHAEYGLWAAFRAAVIIPAAADAAAAAAADTRPDAASSPCDACAEKPCLSACPVNAFSAAGYDVPACTAHLAAHAPAHAPESGGADCMNAGCLARRACPHGRPYAHEPAQAAFHMRRFLAARRA